MKPCIPIAVAFALISAGCGKPDDARPVTPVSPMKQNNLETPVVPTPPLPKVASDVNPVPGPAPGQANDHSSPMFKDGGLPSPKKY